jgi:DNA-binding MarR family transcriptional regulator
VDPVGGPKNWRVRELPWDPVAAAESNWVAHGWGRAAPGMAATTSVLRAYRRYQAAAERLLRPLHLNMSRYEVLMLLYFSRRATLPVGIIADRLQMSQGAVTNLVDRLENSAYVVRTPNPLDGRGRLASLTESGHEAAERATAIMNSELFEAIDLEVEEVRTLNVLLWKLRLSLL